MKMSCAMVGLVGLIVMAVDYMQRRRASVALFSLSRLRWLSAAQKKLSLKVAAHTCKLSVPECEGCHGQG